MKAKKYPPTPELDRMGEVHDHSQAIGEFLGWLGNQGIALCRFDKESESYFMDYVSIEKRLAEYFEIDLNKVEQERRTILKHLQKAQP